MLGTPSAELAGQATEWTRTSDTYGCYSGYSDDTTAGDVSSPWPRTRRVYSKDTQIRA